MPCSFELTRLLSPEPISVSRFGRGQVEDVNADSTDVVARQQGEAAFIPGKRVPLKLDAVIQRHDYPQTPEATFQALFADQLSSPEPIDLLCFPWIWVASQ